MMLVIFIVGCNERKESSLVDAIICGDIKSVDRLLSEGVNPNEVSEDGLVPILVATGSTSIVSDLYTEKLAGRVNEDIAILRLLLMNGANANFQGKNGRTPLIYAVYHGRVASILLLLKHGANPNAVNEMGFTPLMYAATHCLASVAHALIKRGASPTIKSSVGKSAFDIASESSCGDLNAYKE